MIRINLAPPSVLKNKLWFVPELALVLIILGLSSYGVGSFLDSIQEDTQQRQNQLEQVQRDIEKLANDVKRFQDITIQLDQLKAKYQSLQKITVSKVGRYLPVIILESLQNLRPEGLWFVSLSMDSQKKTLALSGASFDNFLIAEFIKGLQDTTKANLDPSNVRSFVYFSHVELVQVSSSSETQMETMTRKEDEKVENMKQAFQDAKEFKTVGEQESVVKSQLFPELEKFPSFRMNIRYAERDYYGFSDRKE